MTRILPLIAAACAAWLCGCSKDPADACPHKWSKWERANGTNLWGNAFQKRTCETCGADEYRIPKQH